MGELDPDEVVYVDEMDGLVFTRADFPAFDFVPGTRVRKQHGTDPNEFGVVVMPWEVEGNVGEGGIQEEVPIRWDDTKDVARWVHASDIEIA